MDKNSKNYLRCIESLWSFRNNIPAKLSREKVEEIWDIDLSGDKYIDIDEKQRKVINRKIALIKDSLGWIVCKPLVRFIGISGSVGSEFAKSGDDIDIFVVTRNDSVWIYRLYLYLRNFSKKVIRSREQEDNLKDKLCVNLLVEERNLIFESDIFNLNELVYLKPVYNEEFLSVIFLQNSWLEKKFLVSEKFLRRNVIKMGMLKNLARRNYLTWLINFTCFLAQVLFMLLMGHSPDLKRLLRGFQKGKIEFYKEDFKKEKLEKLDT